MSLYFFSANFMGFVTKMMSEKTKIFPVNLEMGSSPSTSTREINLPSTMNLLEEDSDIGIWRNIRVVFGYKRKRTKKEKEKEKERKEGRKKEGGGRS